jgi:branched-chain amino acid transport system permease protein
LFLIGILRGGLYSLMAIGLTLMMGVMNVPSFVHGELLLIGAYLGWFANQILGLNPILSLLFAALGSLLAGILLEKGFFWTLRRKSEEAWLLNSYLVTVGLSFVIQNVALGSLGAVYRGVPNYWEGSIQFGPSVSVSIDRIFGFVTAMVAIFAFWLFLRRTKVGREIRAVAQDEQGAMLVGINLDTIYALTFGLSSMMAGIAGAALLPITPAFPTMGLVPLAKSWYVVILAGLGNIGGAVVGGLVVGMLETTTYYHFGAGWQEVISVFVLILILLVKPSGLFGSEVKGILER